MVELATWKVRITKKAEFELKKLLIEKSINKNDVRVLLRWIDEMEEMGPKYIAYSKEWHDHSLDFKWIGYRSSAFSSSGRVIYKVMNNEIVVVVHRVTANHNYK